MDHLSSRRGKKKTLTPQKPLIVSYTASIYLHYPKTGIKLTTLLLYWGWVVCFPFT